MHDLEVVLSSHEEDTEDSHELVSCLADAKCQLVPPGKKLTTGAVENVQRRFDGFEIPVEFLEVDISSMLD